MANDSSPVLTEAIKSYDGIFKGMHDDNLRSKFLCIRQLLSNGKLKEGKSMLSEVLAQTDAKDHPLDKNTLELIDSELERYIKFDISKFNPSVTEINFDEVQNRTLAKLTERHWSLPQSIFFLTFKIGPKKYRLVGRKLLSDLWIKNKIQEIHCSRISAGMILGPFSDQRVTESSVNIFYHPLNNGEKYRIMTEITDHKFDDVELVFPFSLLRKSTMKELCSPAEGWVVDDAFDIMLGCGEERIREYTIEFLGKLQTSNPLLFDPACSTGVFLSTLKKAFPNSCTVGQDLSKQMVGFAKARVDIVHCGNAIEPKISPETADVVFVRFLNSEVVTSAEAEDLLFGLLPPVKKKGYMIVFGHTPVLLSSANFSLLENFILIQSIGISCDKTGIFQYYVLQKL